MERCFSFGYLDVFAKTGAVVIPSCLCIPKRFHNRVYCENLFLHLERICIASSIHLIHLKTTCACKVSHNVFCAYRLAGTTAKKKKTKKELEIKYINPY